MRWNAVRYLLASMHVLYYSLHEASESGGNGSMINREWDAIISRQLLGADEAVIVSQYSGLKPFLLATWALGEIQAQVDHHNFSAAPPGTQSYDLVSAMRQENVIALFRDQALQFRSHAGFILNSLKLQVPFPYFHLVNLIMMWNCLLISYGLVPMATWPLGMLVTAVFATVILGFRALALALADPFGSDEVRGATP